MNCYKEAIGVMTEQFGHDVAMSLATVSGDKANVRVINAYFKQDSFFITTYLLSNKMKEILANPNVALCYNLFVAHGTGINLGNPILEQNSALSTELREVFCAFYDRHVDETDPNTCILKIELIDAVICTNNAKYIIDVLKKTAEKQNFVNDIVV